MTDKTKTEQEVSPAQEADERSYEAPEVSTIGTVGELTSANESSGPS
jgi:hypothetical protein